MEDRQPHDSFWEAAFKSRRRNQGKHQTMDVSLMEQLANGCAERRIQQELLTRDDLTLSIVFATMRAHNSARKETDDLGTFKAAPVHNVSMKPERGKPQRVIEAAQDTMETDLTMAANLQDTMGLDLIAAEDILDTMEPDLTTVETLLGTTEPCLLATHRTENPPDGEFRTNEAPKTSG